MATAALYVCQSCGSSYGKWVGRCSGCEGWNTIIAETATRARRSASSAQIAFVDLSAPVADSGRHVTGISELDLVLGGGPGVGSTILIGGDPGIGKSTLLLQACAYMCGGGLAVAYVSGEEGVAQIQGRARRLALDARVRLAAETRLETILDGLKADRPDIVVIDSIQTMFSEAVEAAPGSVGQVRACTDALARYARGRNCTVFLVGHITKDGQIAGPRVLEHIVDTVLYFEGAASHHFRILRAVKNRFGPTDEIGVFEMTDSGLHSASDPSALFMGDSQSQKSAGRAVLAAQDGSRPFLAEIQALAGPEAPGSARRSVVGWDASRLAMLLAVLETRCGLDFGRRDVYLTVAGGYRIREPAGDLAAAAALISSRLDRPVPDGSVFFGEVALSGDIRPASRAEPRLREAERMGHRRAFTAAVNAPDCSPGMRIHPMSTVGDVVGYLEQG